MQIISSKEYGRVGKSLVPFLNGVIQVKFYFLEIPMKI